MAARRLCFASRVGGIAGPASFQRRMADGLARRHVECSYEARDSRCDAVLVIGATRRLAALRRARSRGIPIVQRLDGRNWIHRRRWTGLRHSLRAEWNNRMLRLVRDRLASAVVYQSEFARRWWERDCGPAPVPAVVVHNGVDLERYTPGGIGEPPADRRRVLVVEARFEGGYDVGIRWALGLAERLARDGGQPVEVVFAGQVGAKSRRLKPAPAVSAVWLGVMPPDEIPKLDRSAHCLFSADLHPACPNSVIEALACGLPVVAFDTGALSELVQGDAGRLVPYGGDPWRVEPPDLDGLATAARHVLADPARFRAAARKQAEDSLSLEGMVQGYMDVLGW